MGIKDKSVDVYISMMTLHLLPHPEKALQEALRVLKDDGRIGIGVLGSAESSTMYSIFVDSLKEEAGEAGFEYSCSDHHLGDKKVLRELFEKNGFEVDYVWDTEILYDVYDEKDIEFLVFGHPENKKKLEELDQNVRGKVKNSVLKKFRNFKERKEPLCL